MNQGFRPGLEPLFDTESRRVKHFKAPKHPCSDNCWTPAPVDHEKTLPMKVNVYPDVGGLGFPGIGG